MKEKVEYVLLDSNSNSNLDKLMNIYKKNPHSARVMFFNERSCYESDRLCMFEREGSFEICHFKNKFGISVTNRMYSRETKYSSIIYKNKKFYYVNSNKKITQLTCNGLVTFLSPFSGYNNHFSYKAYDILAKKFSWLRFIYENPVLHKTAFNTFVTHKLYNLNDALRYVFKCPAPIAKLLISSHPNHLPCDVLKIWKEQRKYLDNIENLKLEFIQNHMFSDTCRMARVLGKRVNCSWSQKRLKLEHNNWAKEITNILLENEEEITLNISKVYKDFAAFSGYKMLLTNKDLMVEGQVQKHCVANYISSVNRGSCAIYHINGYTLEVQYRSGYLNEDTKKALRYNQLRGFGNDSAPKELDDEVRNMIIEFNNVTKEKEYLDVSNVVEDFAW